MIAPKDDLEERDAKKLIKFVVVMTPQERIKFKYYTMRDGTNMSQWMRKKIIKFIEDEDKKKGNKQDKLFKKIGKINEQNAEQQFEYPTAEQAFFGAR